MEIFAENFKDMIVGYMRSPYVIHHNLMQDTEYNTFERLLWHYFIDTYPKYSVYIRGDIVGIHVETETPKELKIEEWMGKISSINRVVKERYENDFPDIKVISQQKDDIIITVSYKSAMEAIKSKEAKKRERIEKEQREIEEKRKKSQKEELRKRKQILNCVTSVNNYIIDITDDDESLIPPTGFLF